MYVFFMINTCFVRLDISCLRNDVNHKNSFNFVRLMKMNHSKILILCLIENRNSFDSSMNFIMFNFFVKIIVFFEFKYMNSNAILGKYRLWRKSNNESKSFFALEWSFTNDVIATSSWSSIIVNCVDVSFVVDNNSNIKFVNCA
jgi:hypothetical protein